jgi:hypothetical protein
MPLPSDFTRCCCAYVPFVRDFLAAQTTQTGGVSPKSFGALIIRNFILEHTLDRSSEYARLLCTALRSFSRFLLLCGQTSRDLSNAVPMFRKYRQSVPPAFLSPSEVEQVLAAPESTLSASRDHAILLLLARLRLRGGEVVALELDDIRWRAGEIVPAEDVRPTLHSGTHLLAGQAGRGARTRHVCSNHRSCRGSSHFRRDASDAGRVKGRQIDSAMSIPGRPVVVSGYQNPVRNPYGRLPSPPQTQAAHFKRLYRK